MLSPETAITVSGLGYVGLPLALEFGKEYRNSKGAELVRELQDYGCEVFVHDPIADPAEAQHEYGIVLTPWEALPQADALIAVVSHRQYRDMPLDDIQSKLQPTGVFVDVKSAYPSQAMTEVGLRVWRM